MPNPSPNICPGGVSPLDTLTRLIDLYDGCARAGILSDLGRADRANLERLRRVWTALPNPETISPWRALQALRSGGSDPRPEAFGPNSAPNP